jgi:serine/threonine-protein kinase RsbW
VHATMTLSLPRQPSTVTRARQMLTTLLSLTDADAEVRDHLAVVISEACANAVLHSDLDSTVDIAIGIDDDDCVLEIGNRGPTPDGVGFGAGLPDPLTVGGRGLPLIAALVDSVTFVAGQPGRVLLRIRKHLVDTEHHTPASWLRTG